jgi:hypothetical protein
MIKYFIIIIFCFSTTKSQPLYENIFYPLDNGGNFGYFVIITDTLMFISAHQDNINGNSSGSLYYYSYNDSNWSFKERIFPDDGQPNDFFGVPHLSKKYLYVGAFGNRGSVYVYKYEDNEWTQTQKLVPDTLIYLSGFGISIQEYNDELFVGASSDSRFVDGSGSVYLYKKSNDGIWEKSQKIYPDIMKEYAHFGYKIETNSKYNHLFISAPEDSNDAGLFAGNVYVLNKSDSLWEVKQILTPDLGEAFPYFGSSIKSKEDYLFIGAPGSGSTQSGGSVYVYKINNSRWEYLKKIISPINVIRDYFGYSIFVEGDSILIGAPGAVQNGVRTARAYLYIQNNDDFNLSYTFEPSDSIYHDGFGIGVSMNKREYLIGAPYGRKAYLYSPYPMSINDEGGLLTDYFLFQNYPNPFNPVTKIKFSIPRSEVVQINVYDVLGKEIKTLLNEYKQAGTYEIEFDATSLPSGVYFYRMISGNYSETKKMILLR